MRNDLLFEGSLGAAMKNLSSIGLDVSKESMLKDNTIQDKWENLNYLEKQVLTTIFDKGEISSEETARIINRGKTTAVKLLNKLVDMNLIVWTGTSKSDNKGKYIIKN